MIDCSARGASRFSPGGPGVRALASPAAPLECRLVPPGCYFLLMKPASRPQIPMPKLIASETLPELSGIPATWWMPAAPSTPTSVFAMPRSLAPLACAVGEPWERHSAFAGHRTSRSRAAVAGSAEAPRQPSAHAGMRRILGRCRSTCQSSERRRPSVGGRQDGGRHHRPEGHPPPACAENDRREQDLELEPETHGLEGWNTP